MERLRLVNRRTGGRFEEHRESLRESPKQSLGSSLVTGSPGRFDHWQHNRMTTLQCYEGREQSYKLSFSVYSSILYNCTIIYFSSSYAASFRRPPATLLNDDRDF